MPTLVQRLFVRYCYRGHQSTIWDNVAWMIAAEFQIFSNTASDLAMAIPHYQSIPYESIDVRPGALCNGHVEVYLIGWDTHVVPERR